MIGPSIPAHLLPKHQEKEEGEPPSPEACGPQLPTSFNSNATPPRRVLGPQLPPPGTFQKQSSKEEVPANFYPTIDDSDDDMIGPLPPRPEDLKVSSLESKLNEINRRAHPEENDDGKPKRGDWMLIPPEPKILGHDPTKVTARQFNRTTVQPKDLDQSLWTDTPEQRAKRQRSGEAEIGPSSRKEQYGPSPGELERQRQLEASVQEYNNETRPKSLLELHKEAQSSKKKKKKTSSKDKDTPDDPDHPANRRFDWDRDMSVKSLDPKRQQELLRKAGSLSDRFESSSRSRYQ